ncbi:MAG: copper chaperone PCu(A)C [Pseudomonadales bacterium]|nr:copper chaperone PCu(A)C [Pseudomonadales bacterium]
MRIKYFFNALGLASLLFSSVVLAGGKLIISDGWVREVPPVSKNTAAYFTLKNTMQKDDVLLYLTSDAAKHTEFHTIIVDPNGAKRMQKMPHYTLKANSEVALKPGGYHVMLIDLKKPLKVGEKVSLELVFQRAGKIKAELEVKQPADTNDKSAVDHSHHHHH